MKVNKKGQITGGVAMAIVVALVVVAILAPILVSIYNDVQEDTTFTPRVVNESESLLNASGATCTGCWTNNFTICNKHKGGWVDGSVVLFNTTTLCAGGCRANVSYIDCAVHLNGTLANGTYNVSYTYFPESYINNTAYQTTAINTVPLLALVFLFIVAMGGIFLLGGR